MTWGFVGLGQMGLPMALNLSKIADCVAVFSLEKLEAFPIDVWVRRALAEWYFPDRKRPTDRVLLEWAQNHFGRYGGYSQQYLFHGRRLER